MMMTNDRKIWEAAMLLVRRHGSDAIAVAESEAERLRADDALTCVVWCWIARSTAELLRPAPEIGEHPLIARQPLHARLFTPSPARAIVHGCNLPRQAIWQTNSVA